MNQRSNGARLLATLLLSTLPASAALVNGNFDADVLAEGNATCSGTIGFTGWSSPGFSCGTGLFNPGPASYPGGNAPSNDNIAYHNGPSAFYQTSASDVWTAGQTQVFSILIGQRLDETYAGYTIELWAGTPLAPLSTLVASQTNAVSPGPGSFVPTSLSFTPTGGETWIGQNVGVLFRGETLGVQTNFDNAELNGVPEPGTLALLGSALLGLGVARRRQGRC